MVVAVAGAAAVGFGNLYLGKCWWVWGILVMMMINPWLGPYGNSSASTTLVLYLFGLGVWGKGGLGFFLSIIYFNFIW